MLGRYDLQDRLLRLELSLSLKAYDDPCRSVCSDWHHYMLQELLILSWLRGVRRICTVSLIIGWSSWGPRGIEPTVCLCCFVA